MPKDIQAFIRLADQSGVDFGLLREAERINKRRVDQFVEKVKKALWVTRRKQIGVLGIAFKPNTDDIRFTPAIEVIKRLLAEGAEVRATDPEGLERARAVLPNVSFSTDPYEVARGADALLVLTELEQFRRLDWKRIRREMAGGPTPRPSWPDTKVTQASESVWRLQVVAINCVELIHCTTKYRSRGSKTLRIHTDSSAFGIQYL